MHSSSFVPLTVHPLAGGRARPKQSARRAQDARAGAEPARNPSRWRVSTRARVTGATLQVNPPGGGTRSFRLVGTAHAPRLQAEGSDPAVHLRARFAHFARDRGDVAAVTD